MKRLLVAAMILAASLLTKTGYAEDAQYSIWLTGPIEPNDALVMSRYPNGKMELHYLKVSEPNKKAGVREGFLYFTGQIEKTGMYDFNGEWFYYLGKDCPKPYRTKARGQFSTQGPKGITFSPSDGVPIKISNCTVETAIPRVMSLYFLTNGRTLPDSAPQ